MKDNMIATAANESLNLAAPMECVSESDNILLVDTNDLRKVAEEVRELAAHAARTHGRAQDSRLVELTLANAEWLEDLAKQIETCGYIAKQSYARPRLEEIEREAFQKRSAASKGAK